jgi:hypothetical protein
MKGPTAIVSTTVVAADDVDPRVHVAAGPHVSAPEATAIMSFEVNARWVVGISLTGRAG